MAVQADGHIATAAINNHCTEHGWGLCDASKSGPYHVSSSVFRVLLANVHVCLCHECTLQYMIQHITQPFVL